MYKLNGVKVEIVRTAEIDFSLYGDNGSKFQEAVQEVLDCLAQDLNNGMEFDWKKPVVYGLDEFGVEFPRYVLKRNADERLCWGRYKFHTSRKPRLSPFVTRSAETSNSLTVELVGSPATPQIVRVYGGVYAPPLPWQVSRKDHEIERNESRDFWATHAFAGDEELRIGTLTSEIPGWALAAS